MKEYRIITIPGDGIGPELMESTIAVLEAVQEMSGALKLNLEEHEAGAGRYAKFGKRISDETLQACHEADGILKSPVGDPAVRTPEGTEGRASGRRAQNEPRRLRQHAARQALPGHPESPGGL